MTKNNIFIRITICMFVVLLLILSVSCNKTGDDPIDSEVDMAHSTKVKKQDFVECGNFIYCEWAPNIYRFNRKTEKIFKACMDVECDGKCPLEFSAVSYFSGVDEENVYFSAYQPSTALYLVAQNIVSGEVEIINTLSKAENNTTHTTFVDDGKWYYKRKILKENGDPAIPNDYESYICGLSIEGKNEELIIRSDDKETLAMVADGKIVTHLDNKFYTVDIKTKEKKELWDYTSDGFITVATLLQYLDGKIYVILKTNQQETSETIGESYNLSFLISVDLTTGKYEYVVESPVFNYCLTDEAIYYVPLKLRRCGGEENARSCIFDESIYRCDLNGENTEKVYTNAMIDFAEIFTVIDNTLYGWLFDYNEDTLTYDKTFFGGIEFDTGRIIRAEKDE